MADVLLLAIEPYSVFLEGFAGDNCCGGFQLDVRKTRVYFDLAFIFHQYKTTSEVHNFRTLNTFMSIFKFSIIGSEFVKDKLIITSL